MKYVCQICGYIYDEEKEKILFKDLDANWECPLCKALKTDFIIEETKKEIKNRIDTKIKPLSNGQIAAILSNLAQGCEKQYKFEEAELFKQLSDYFTSLVSNIDDGTLETISQKLKEDIENYPALRQIADNNNDRGADRVCVWGEKVTRMVSSIVDRYLKDGEKMLAGTEIYVCSVCGFVYIGDKAPDLCPVCKVPDWKFEKVEGRV